jgi:hypothetical protein
MKLHLGIEEFPYGDKGSISTGDVAEILEGKYGIMEHFYYNHEQEILNDIAETYLGITSGTDSRSLDSDIAIDSINERFRRFLADKEMDGQIDGVPTKASLLGKSIRFKRKKGPVRPSFIDSGLYEVNFRAWTNS